MIPSAVENVRPRWQEQPLSLSGPPHGRLSAVGRLQNNLALIIVALYLLLNWGFQQIRIPPMVGGGVPAAELFLLLFLLTINPLRTLAQLSRSIFVLPFIGWWFFGLGRAAVDVAGSGFWALRDAAHVIESLFLVVGFVFAANPASLERFFKWLPRLLLIAACYGLLYPVRESLWTVSPYIISPNGIPVPIFGIMANSGFLLIMAGLYLLLFRPRNVATLTLAMILIAYPVAVIQARTLYLTVIALFGFVIVFRPSARGHISAIVALSAFALAVLSLTGLQVEGRLGVSLSPEFVVNHFLAIFGICPPGQEMVCAAAAGVPQRLAWWQDILRRMLSDPLKLLLGLGYGVVLTDFHSNSAVAVREPHNSYITIFARTGVIGLLCWLSMMAILVRRWYWTFLRCGEFGWRIGQNRLMILMVFFICMWVLAIGEDGFEKPYNIVPFYFFWGIVLRFSLHLKEGRIGPDLTA
jgi:hypothetical protein